MDKVKLFDDYSDEAILAAVKYGYAPNDFVTVSAKAIFAVEAMLNDLSLKLHEANEKVEAQGIRIKELEDTVERLSSTLERVDNGLNAVQGNVDRMEAYMSKSAEERHPEILNPPSP